MVKLVSSSSLVKDVLEILIMLSSSESIIVPNNGF